MLMDEKRWIDLRSDTVTVPSREMLLTVLEAQLGDDGRRITPETGGDGTVNEMEALAARITGKEAAILFPSGTMANTAALLTWAKPGDMVLVDRLMHLYLREKTGFVPALGGLLPVFYDLAGNGSPDMASVEHALAAASVRLACIETTHNFSGGSCQSPVELAQFKELCGRAGIPVHMDGARLFNAVCALGVEAEEICHYADSVMFCLSKGLGAPVGSLLCGPRDFCRRVREMRKALGGAMRKAGVIAAPGIYALKHNVPGLKEDNEKARYVAERLRKLEGTFPIRGSVPSNILILDTAGEETCRALMEELKVRGILCNKVPGHGLRFVWHNGVNWEDTRLAAELIVQAAGRIKECGGGETHGI